MVPKSPPLLPARPFSCSRAAACAAAAARITSCHSVSCAKVGSHSGRATAGGGCALRLDPGGCKKANSTATRNLNPKSQGGVQLLTAGRSF